MSNWTDQIVGDRMTVDRQFTERVTASEFSSQEWGMIMTAVEFEIERADTPDEATLVANTKNVPQVMDAVDDVNSQMGAMGGAPGGGSPDRGNGGLFDSIKGALGLGDDDSIDEDRVAAAQALADEYATELETHLKENGKWERACQAAAGTETVPDAATEDDEQTTDDADKEELGEGE